MGILALCHSKIAPFKNPEGPDYDRFTPDLHAKTWGLTHKWADYVLFLNFETHVDAGKAPGPRAWAAPAACSTPSGPPRSTPRTATACRRGSTAARGAAEAWANLAAAMKAGRRPGHAAPGPAEAPPADVPQDRHQTEP